MNNKETKKRSKFVKPFFTVTELSQIFGMSRYGTRLMLYRMCMPYTYVGSKMIFMLSDIRDHSPALWASILEANQLNDLLKQQKLNLDSESVSTPDQFNRF